jgi:hypothetical protein
MTGVDNRSMRFKWFVTPVGHDYVRALGRGATIVGRRRAGSPLNNKHLTFRAAQA